MARVKVCCISNLEEARIAIDEGADAIGLVSAMPSGPGVIAEEIIADIVRSAPPFVTTTLLTSQTTLESIKQQIHSLRPKALQIVTHVSADILLEIKRGFPLLSLIQVIHVRGAESVDLANSAAAFVDAILLDSGNPAASVPELGGTGRVHDWSLSKAIVESCSVPVILAGGLSQTNVAEALSKVNPYAVDVCSGVRTNGKLDRTKLRAFMKAAKFSTGQ